MDMESMQGLVVLGACGHDSVHVVLAVCVGMGTSGHHIIASLMGKL